MESSATTLQSQILARLASAGAAGLALAKLPGVAKARSGALQALLAARSIGNLGSAQKPRYVLVEHFQPLELAAAHVEGLARPGEAAAFTLAKLEAGTTGAVKAQVRKAVEVLTKERSLVRITIGRAGYFVHAASLRPLLGADAEGKEEEDFPEPGRAAGSVPAEPARDTDLAAAYERARRLAGFSDVTMASLRRESGLPLADFHRTLLTLGREGRADFSLGDWSLSTDEERAAALSLDGVPYLRARLVNIHN